jgi:hypothetical protein
MRANPKYPGQLQRMNNNVTSGRAVVVYLRRYARGRQRYNPTEQELRDELRFTLLARGSDGAIYHAARAATSTTTTSPTASGSTPRATSTTQP